MPGSADAGAAARARFERTVADVYEPLQRYVRRRAGAATVDDVVADTLLVLWRRLDEVDDATVLLWCYGVARRVLANHRRATARGLRLIDRLSGAARHDEFVEPPLDVRLAQGGMVRDALLLLTPDDREVLTLWAWEGLEAREVAMVLGITANAAAIRLHRAKRRLADRLGTRKIVSPAGHSVFGHPETR